MIALYQTDFSRETGNCLQACVASMLEVSLDQVPNFAKYGECWFVRLREYLRYWGLDGLYVSYPQEEQLQQMVPQVTAIAIIPVKDAGENDYHAVITNHTQIIHDPNPNGVDLVMDVTTWNFLYFIPVSGFDGEILRFIKAAPSYVMDGDDEDLIGEIAETIEEQIRGTEAVKDIDITAEYPEDIPL
jgi:hypothetical protein